uniref:HTH_11 domain-containing protein n=1 Tax=Strongyloides venezuelensis TaxID=75913 RepID=A0A0K0G660_STRVS
MRTSRTRSVENLTLFLITMSNEKLLKLIHGQDVKKLAKQLNVSKYTILLYLKVIEKTKKLDKWKSYELNDNQNTCRSKFCYPLILRNKNDSFIRHLATCVKRLTLYDNFKRTGQWLNKD